ncbi:MULTISPECIES: hypothetical protein [unclassified Ruegeria]|uniref:hypothetical protein n=1 Tax=unclassified Ruegeria TaxID=2625375 RepID=UPI0014890540|nr:MULTISPECIES: hypothetical protein [unclassified Ruegeria]
MDNQTRRDLEQVQDILEQRIHELTHGDNHAFREETPEKLAVNFWKRLPLSLLLRATKAVMVTGSTNANSGTRPPEVFRV